MSKRPIAEFHYSHILAKKPPVDIAPVRKTNTCPCGAEFTTRSRNKFRCYACQAAVDHLHSLKYQERRKLAHAAV